MRTFTLVKCIPFLIFFPSLIAQDASQVPDALMMRFPTVSAEQIAFVYAEDLWVVGKKGGIARKISSAKGMEMFPRFSPDGKYIAFTGNYDGNQDIYIIPALGGEPTRVTHHPDAERIVDWYPDGRNLLIASSMQSPSTRFAQFFKQPLPSGLPKKIPLFYGEFGNFNDDGKKLAFQLQNRQFRNWKRYQGGQASDIWIFDSLLDSAYKITDFQGTDALPMWRGNTIYFVSDRGPYARLNIYGYDTKTKKFNRITNFSEYDVKFPSLGAEEIIFENGGKLYLLNLQDYSLKTVHIKVPSDLLSARPSYKLLQPYITDFSLSPSGKRALFCARGKIFTVPQNEGFIRNLTPDSKFAARDPVWSPDGKHIAFFADTTGEYELYIIPADGKGEVKQLTKDSQTFYYNPVWSPDSKQIAFSDKTGTLYVIDVESGERKKIDKDNYYELRHYKWSPDSRWITYARNRNLANAQIKVYDTKESADYELTSGFYNDNSPEFSEDGKYLYFYSNRDFQSLFSGFQGLPSLFGGAQLYGVTLNKDEPSPTAPKNDEEETLEDQKGLEEDDQEEELEEEGDNERTNDKTEDANSEKEQDFIRKDENKDSEGNGDGKETDHEDEDELEGELVEEEKEVSIDVEGFEFRAVRIPLFMMNFKELTTVNNQVIALGQKEISTDRDSSAQKFSLLQYDMTSQQEQTIIEGIEDFSISANGQKVLYKSGDVYGIIDLFPGFVVGDGQLNTAKMEMLIDPREEWKQIFDEAWRIERDYFYDPKLHQVDWEKVKERYKKLLPFATSRNDVNYIIGEMLGELNVGHAYVGGGDIAYTANRQVGMLGVDFELDEEYNAYKIEKIYKGAPWDVDIRSPLLEPGLEVKEGDYILAVNDRKLDISKDPWAAFQGMSGEIISLTVCDTPQVSEEREILVRTLYSETSLRNLAWVEENRKKVFEATDGKVGYVYVPNTGYWGQQELIRMFQGQHDMPGLIIDERFNSGGQIPDRFIELLGRKIFNYWGRRDHNQWQTPAMLHNGPKVMIVNEWAGSGGDALPYYFKQEELGPIVGKRTWGGLVGISGNPQLIDGGFISVPTFGFWSKEGGWDIEGYGVDPDYEVDNPPHIVAKGKDPQLEKAIELILEAISDSDDLTPMRPPSPNRKGIGPGRKE